MTVWRFSLVIDGPDLDNDELLDALFEAGCDDALFGGLNGKQCADFHREAAHLEEAVLTAIADVESVANLQVVELLERPEAAAEATADPQMFTALIRAVEARRELRTAPADRRARVGEFVGLQTGTTAGD